MRPLSVEILFSLIFIDRAPRKHYIYSGPASVVIAESTQADFQVNIKPDPFACIFSRISLRKEVQPEHEASLREFVNFLEQARPDLDVNDYLSPELASIGSWNSDQLKALARKTNSAIFELVSCIFVFVADCVTSSESAPFVFLSFFVFRRQRFHMRWAMKPSSSNYAGKCKGKRGLEIKS